jgi:hypothetical protein
LGTADGSADVLGPDAFGYRAIVAPYEFEAAIAKGLEQGVINDLEARTVREAMELTAAVIAVDEFGEHRQPLEDTQPAASAS